MRIHRAQVKVGQKFTAPLEITAGYQEKRQAFSIWYRSADLNVDKLKFVSSARISYAILATGSEAEIIRIRQTIIMPDGFHAFHLCEVL